MKTRQLKLNPLSLAMRDILVSWNRPALTQQMINWYATGWQGDPYAMVQRQEEMASKNQSTS